MTDHLRRRDSNSGPTARGKMGAIEKLTDEQLDHIMGLHPAGRVCRNDACYSSTVDGQGELTHAPRVHDPVDGCDFR